MIQPLQKRFALTSLSSMLLLGVALVLLNLVLSEVPLRWDMTAQKVYSLSRASKTFAASLDDQVVIKAYFTPDLPAPYNVYARYVRDILHEYRLASHGKIHFEFVPALPAAPFEQKAGEAGMMSIQFEEVGSSQLQIRRGFMGLAMFYRDRSETLPLVKSVDALEYDITSRLLKMAKHNKKVIALSSGHGETHWRVPQFKLSEDLAQLYDFKDVSLAGGTTSAVQADALLIVGPQKKFDEKALRAIDQTLMSGVPLGFLVDTKEFMPQQFFVVPRDAGLGELLQSYGAHLGEQILYDNQCETVSMTQNIGGLAFPISLRFAFIPLITHFAKDHPILRGIESVGVPFVTRVEAVSPLPTGLRFVPLLSTSVESWLAPVKTYSVSPNTVPKPKPEDPHGPFAVAALLEGNFPSAFKTGTSPKTAIFVMSTSHLLDPSLPNFSGNASFITNMMAFLSKDEMLLGISAKGSILRPLRPIPGAPREIIRLLCVLGVPLFPVVWGLWRWRRRNAWRRTMDAAFTAK